MGISDVYCDRTQSVYKCIISQRTFDGLSALIITSFTYKLTLPNLEGIKGVFTFLESFFTVHLRRVA